MLQAPTSAATIDHMETMQRVGVIHLKGGGFTVVDPERVEELNQFKWRLNVWGYAVTTIPGKQRHIGMHRMVLKAPAGVGVDHRFGVTLDNRACNLRLANQSRNGANAKIQVGRTSSYKGVSWNRFRNQWRAQLMVNYKSINLGGFDSEEDAARAYNAAALEHFGEFAKINAL